MFDWMQKVFGKTNRKKSCCEVKPLPTMEKPKKHAIPSHLTMRSGRRSAIDIVEEADTLIEDVAAAAVATAYMLSEDNNARAEEVPCQAEPVYECERAEPERSSFLGSTYTFGESSGSSDHGSHDSGSDDSGSDDSGSDDSGSDDSGSYDSGSSDCGSCDTSCGGGD